jgi:hypothetical protein
MIFTRHVGRNGRVFGTDSITNNQGSIMNKYVAGSGVGATSSFARRAKLYRSITRVNSQPSITSPIDLVPGILNTIAVYLRNYMTEFRNTNFWAYKMDGTNVYIQDGGNDMFDDGIFITPWLLSGDRYDLSVTETAAYSQIIQYDTVTETTVDTSLKYISLGYILETSNNEQINKSLHPLTVLCYRPSGPVGWQNGGEIGADGTGVANHGYVYENVIVNGFNVYAGYRQVWGAANDPTICQLVILLGHSSWGSVFGPVEIISDDSDSGYCRFVMYAGDGSKNIMALFTLLSKPNTDSDDPIPTAELETVIFNFTKRIKEACFL